MDTSRAQWILAFDASCGRCRRLSAQIDSAADGKLEIRPLNHPEVQQLRESYFGGNPPWVPTLIARDRDDVKIWIGRSIAPTVARVLGLRKLTSLITELGTLSTAPDAPHATLTRKSFFRLGAGLLAAGGFVATGAVPAFAATTDAERWLRAQGTAAPTSYRSLAAVSMDRRIVAYRALSSGQRSRAWVEHLRWFASSRPLDNEGKAFVDEMISRAAEPATFAGTTDVAEAQALRERAEKILGASEAKLAVATLGPAEGASSAMNASGAAMPMDQRGCTCATTDDWCDNSTHCFRTDCINHEDCGFFWSTNCDGLCRN